MTNVAVWYVPQTKEVWGVADARMSSLTSPLTDRAGKILPLNLRWSEPTFDPAGGWRVVGQSTIGFAFCGSALAALLTHAALSVFLQNLGSVEGKPPELARVAKLCAFISERYIKDIGVTNGARAISEYLIYGRCPVKNEFEAIYIKQGLKDDGTFAHELLSIDLFGGEVGLLGKSTEALKDRIEELRALNSPCFRGVEPRIAVEERIRKESFEAVGGTLQFGIAKPEDFSVHASVYDKENITGAIQYLGFSLAEDIEPIIGQFIPLTALL